MSKEAVLERTEENMFVELAFLVDNRRWEEARGVITYTMDTEFQDVAKAMTDYYNIEVCKDCKGMGTVVEGDYDNQYEVQCLCQK